MTAPTFRTEGVNHASIDQLGDKLGRHERLSQASGDRRLEKVQGVVLSVVCPCRNPVLVGSLAVGVDGLEPPTSSL